METSPLAQGISRPRQPTSATGDRLRNLLALVTLTTGLAGLAVGYAAVGWLVLRTVADVFL